MLLVRCQLEHASKFGKIHVIAIFRLDALGMRPATCMRLKIHLTSMCDCCTSSEMRKHTKAAVSKYDGRLTHRVGVVSCRLAAFLEKRRTGSGSPRAGKV